MSDETLSPNGRDSDLVFAALAYRLDLVRREDLLESLECWASDRSRPLAGILLERDAIAPRCRALLDEVVREYLFQHDEDAARGLWAACTVRPDDLDLGRFADSSGPLPPTATPPDSTPPTLGSFWNRFRRSRSILVTALKAPNTSTRRDNPAAKVSGKSATFEYPGT